MNRRGFLRGGAVGGGLALAGCLERLGFEQESAWRDPPLVADRPNAVYVPASTEEMGHYATATDGEYAVSLSYTFPHRFWLVGNGTSQVDVEREDTLHLMLTVWDDRTNVVLPVRQLTIELLREGGLIEAFDPWPMLSQRMGFHYGDNVELAEEGSYTARVRVGPVDAKRTGAFDGRFDEVAMLEVDFEYARSDVHDLGFELIDEQRQGTHGALELMDHGDHRGSAEAHEDTDHGNDDRGKDDYGGEGHDTDGSGSDDHGDHDDGDGHDESDGHVDADPGHPPTSRGPPIDELPGELLGEEHSADAKLSILESDLDRLAGADPSALVVCPRTPYNDVILPFMGISATVERAGSVVVDAPLGETIDHEFGHHYGVGIESLEAGDEVTVSVDTPPLLARHDGYETAFFEFEDVTVAI